MNDYYSEIKKCRSCNSHKLTKIISLGKQHVVGFTAKKRHPVRVPLQLLLCTNCKLMQLKHTTNPNLLWNSEYGYRSGVNQTMRNELKSIVRIIEKICKLDNGDVILDIGCNDGTLLKYYKNKVIRTGFDPSHNVISLAYNNLERFGEEYFHLVVDFFRKKPYLEKFKLEVFDVSTNNINGGSFRTFIKKASSKLSTIKGKYKVEKMLQDEAKQGLLDKNTYIEFAKRIKNTGKELVDFIKSEVQKGKKVYVYGASTRGNTLLQYFGLDNRLITAAAERNPYKWGKYTAGTLIPIIPEEKARVDNPEYLLALPWYFKKEFLKREDKYLKNGVEFIFPLPKFEVISYENINK